MAPSRSRGPVRSHQAQDPVGVVATEGLQGESTWLTPLLGSHSTPGPSDIICQPLGKYGAFILS